MERRIFAKLLMLGTGGIAAPRLVAEAGDPTQPMDLDRLRLCSDFVNATFESPILEHWTWGRWFEHVQHSQAWQEALIKNLSDAGLVGP